MLKQNIILKTYYAIKHIVNSLNDGTMWTLILTSVFIITYFIFFYMSMFTCSGRRRERNLFTISPAAENTLSDGTDAALLHCHQKVSPVWQWSFFLDGTVNSGSTKSISSKTLSFYKADRKHIFSDHFSDVGRGLPCPFSIRLRCPDHETSHWLLLTCGWTSWVLRSQMIVHCSGWPMISKPRTGEFALHFIFIHFIKGAPDITLIWHCPKFS